VLRNLVQRLADFCTDGIHRLPLRSAERQSSPTTRRWSSSTPGNVLDELAAHLLCSVL